MFFKLAKKKFHSNFVVIQPAGKNPLFFFHFACCSHRFVFADQQKQNLFCRLKNLVRLQAEKTKKEIFVFADLFLLINLQTKKVFCCPACRQRFSKFLSLVTLYTTLYTVVCGLW